MIVCRECGHHNPDGTTFCRNPECGRFLEWSGESVDTGALPKIDATSAPAEVEPAPTRKRVRFFATLEQSDVAVEPGGVARIKLKVVNKGEIVDRFRLQVLGEVTAWASVDRPDVSLLPETEDGAEVIFGPPRSSIVSSGPKRFRLRVSSSEDPEVSTVLEGLVHVGAFHGLSADLVPRNSRGRQEARASVHLQNEGNAPLYARLTARDPDAALAFDFSPPELEVGPGEERTAEMTIRARESRLTGAALTHQLQVSIEADPVPEVRLDGTFVQSPSLPKVTRVHAIAARVLLTLLGALIMIAGAFASWLFGERGMDVTYDEYVSAAFGGEVAGPPSELEAVASVAIPAIFLAGLALLGIFGKGRLTRFASLLAVLLYVAFFVTLVQGGVEPGIGVWAVLIGGVIAFIGGLLGYVKRSGNA